MSALILDTGMPLELDNTDLAILRALMEDGRRSFREIAHTVGVSAPTVESRVRRLFQTGIIRKVAPILDPDKVERGVAALVLLKADLQELENLVKSLAALEEVRNVFITTGEANLVVRVVAPSNEKIQDLLVSQISRLRGVTLASIQIITRTYKDEQGVPLTGPLAVSLKCDTCGDEVHGKPFILNVGEGQRFFCCKTCLSTYKQKYGSRIENLTGEHLHS
ncbi:MAG: AsnC family transcriptional regulator [Candidatus Bathyarchaeia archaeon]